MQSADVSQTKSSIENQINSVKTYNATSAAQKDSDSKSGNAFQRVNNDVASQLSEISEKQKRFQREVPNSMESLLDFLGMTESSGSTETYKYLRRKMIEVAVKIEPQIQDIIAKQTLKALGCSQEQTYDGYELNQLSSDPFSTLNVSDGIYVPVQSIDLFGDLKSSPDTLFGQFYYEKLFPGLTYRSKKLKRNVTLQLSDFEPYGGPEPYPMNRQLNELMGSKYSGSSFKTVIGDFYQGKSTQPLFDVQYTNINGFGVSGDYFRVLLLDRENANGTKRNTVGDFIIDYYKTIKIVDPVTITAQVIKYLLGAANVSTSFGSLEQQSKFEILIQRILGLCFDRREEIDVSGVSKIAELDGVDESFFEFNEIDLRKINQKISNIQNGIVEFIDCNNIKLPFDPTFLNQQLVTFRDNLSENSDSENVDEMSKIFDDILQDKAWQDASNTGLDISGSFNKNIIKGLPLAVASGVLTPKVLFPIFVLLSVVQNASGTTLNQVITSANTAVSSASTDVNQVITNSNQANSIVVDSVDFIKKFRSFTIEVVSLIGAIFVKELFETLKRDLITLLSVVIKDINKATRDKYKRQIIKLIDIFEILGTLALTLQEARKCKNLLNSIKRIMDLILSKAGFTPKIPPPLLLLADALPGYSSERATINVIEYMQKNGLETGPLPDGTPNQMVPFVSSILKGNDKESSENSKIDAIGVVPPVVGGFVKIFGKPV